MRLPPQFAAPLVAPPTGRCSACHKRGGFVRPKGAAVHACMYCGHVEGAPLREAPRYIAPPKPEATVFVLDFVLRGDVMETRYAS